MNAAHTEPIIETKDLTIRFGGHVAVDHVNFKMEPFTLKSIIGPNGAGKTTFFNMLTAPRTTGRPGWSRCPSSAS